jgi:ABC-type transport system substrate-binding protein
MNARTALLLAALAASPLAADAQTTLRRTVDRMPSFDPVQSESVGAMRCVTLVYETLLEYDYLARPYRLRGGLAEGLPEISADGRTLTFRLRHGVRFGPDACLGADPATGGPGTREVVAADVVYSLKRLADAKLGSPGYWTIEGKIEGVEAFYEASKDQAPTDYSREIAGLRALDEHTVEMRLAAPSPDFLWVLAMPYTAIVPREAVERYGADFESVEVGTGPYRLVTWRRNYRYAFERRPGRDIARDATPLLPDARDALPIERIVYLVMEDPSTRWLSFLSGGLDVAGDISRDNWDAVIGPDGELTEDMKRRDIRRLSKPSLDTYYIGFNLDDPVLGGNLKLRQALSCASDPRQWETLNAGRVVGSSGPVPPGIAGRLETPSPFAFNPEKAKALLAEAGYPDGIDPATGRRLTLVLDLGRTDQEIRETAELFASFMDRIGVVVKLQYNNWPSFLKKIARREAQMFLIGWMADYPSALNFMQLFVGRNASPGPNRSNYANPDYDALYDKADTTLDDNARLALIAQMQERIREACPWIFLYHRKDNLLLLPHVRNVVLHDFPYGAEKHWRMTPR